MIRKICDSGKSSAALAALVALAMTACTPGPDATANQAIDRPLPVADAVTGSVAGVSGEVLLELLAADGEVRTQSGEKIGGALQSNGKGGVLAYGPYRKMGQGRYVLVIEGATSTPFALEVSSGKAADFHGRLRVPVGLTPMATLPFDLPVSVEDLEVRVIVPEGADTRIDGYKIIRR